MTLFQELDRCPASIQVVASADFKSVDPVDSDVVVPLGTTAFRVNLNITAASGGGGVTVTIQGYDPGSDTFYTLLVSALKTATGFTQLLVDPRITASANLIAQVPVPRKVRVHCVGSGTRTTLNYSVGVDCSR